MSAPAKCPLCDTKLRPDWDSCPNCPMSFRDAPPEKTALQGDLFRNYGIPLMIFGGVAYFVWMLGANMLRVGEDNARSGGPSIVKQAVSGIPAAAGEAPSDSGEKNFVPKLVNPSSEDQGLGTLSIMSSKDSKQGIVRDWRIRGGVYDLITLKPLAGAIVTFTDNMTNSRAQVAADARGRYRALLPPLVGRGYVVTLFNVGYEKTCLDPGIVGVRDLPIARRRELVKDLASMISRPFAFEPDSEDPLEADFYLAPKSF